MDAPTFWRKFQAAATDKEKLLVVVYLVSVVATEYASQSEQEIFEAIKDFAFYLESIAKHDSQ